VGSSSFGLTVCCRIISIVHSFSSKCLAAALAALSWFSVEARASESLRGYALWRSCIKSALRLWDEGW
jgi:hypothetical protein